MWVKGGKLKARTECLVVNGVVRELHRRRVDVACGD